MHNRQKQRRGRTLGLQLGVTSLAIALALAACDKTSDSATDTSAQSSSDSGAESPAASGDASLAPAAGSGGSNADGSSETFETPGQFPLMVYGDTSMFVTSPTLSDLGANLLFASYVASHPTAYAFEALAKAPLGKGQIVFIIDPDTVGNYNAEKGAKLDAFLAVVANHPSVYGFYLYDEPNLSSRMTRQKLQAVHDHCKAAAPNKPTLTILAANLNWGNGAGGSQLLGVADIEGFSFTPFGGCDGKGYCHRLGEYQSLLRGFVSAHEVLAQNNTKAYWPFVTSFHTETCDKSCGFSPPTKEVMAQIIDTAIAIDPKFDNGLMYFLYDWSTYVGIKKEPSIAAAVSAVNKERVSRRSVFPVHPFVTPPSQTQSEPSCAGTKPAEMVKMPEGYSIDRTEVTRCQYQAWLDSNPSREGQHRACTWNESYVPRCEWPPKQNGNQPVVCVDWCDAYAYCKGVGKRLCGKIGGGPDEYNNDVSESQWVNACSAGGSNTYVYGSDYDATKCNGYQRGIRKTADVASLSECQSTKPGYSGVYDLSGSVWEWEDSCNSASGAGAYCRLRGGSYLGMDPKLLACQYKGPGDLVFERRFSYPNAGFRCCAD